MSTLAEVRDVFNKTRVSAELSDASSAAGREFLDRYRRLGRAICEEQHVEINGREAFLLPLTTKLGAQAEARFEELKTWLRDQGLRLPQPCAPRAPDAH